MASSSSLGRTGAPRERDSGVIMRQGEKTLLTGRATSFPQPNVLILPRTLQRREKHPHVLNEAQRGKVTRLRPHSTWALRTGT